MTFYAVRIKEDHEAVGLFTAETLKDLWWLTDQVCDPGTCQYKRLVNCGIVWTGPTELKFPTTFPMEDDGNDDAPDFVGVSMDGPLWNYLNIIEGHTTDEGWKDMEMFSMQMLA